MACRAHALSRSTVRHWQETDDQFTAAFQQAEVIATERLEGEAWRRAVEGTPYKRTSYWHGEPVGTDEKIEFSDTLLLALLRARAPDRYRDKVDVTVNQTIKAIGGVLPHEVL